MFRIPIQKTGGEVLNEGIQKLLDRLMKQKELENEAQYRNATLSLSQQKLPFETRELSARASKAEDELKQSQFFRQLWDSANQNNNQNTNNGTSTYNYGGSQPDQVTNANIANNGGNYNPNDSIQNKNDISKPNLKDIQRRLENGEEVELIPPRNQKLIPFDSYAGSTIPHTGIKLPDIKSWTDKNGIRHDRYPSGREIARKVEMSEEERINIREEAQANLADKKQLIKDKKEDDDFFRNFAEYADNNEAVAKIFARNHAVSGILPFARKKFKFGQKDYASVNRLTAPMVGDLAHKLSQKGSNYALQMAQSGKYDPSQPYDYNVGILETNNDAIVRDYNRRAENYREKYGKEPPYKLPKYYKEWEQKQKTSSNDNGEPPTNNQGTNNIPEGAEFIIYDPQGKALGYMSKKDAAIFLNAHKGHYQKAITNGQ